MSWLQKSRKERRLSELWMKFSHGIDLGRCGWSLRQCQAEAIWSQYSCLFFVEIQDFISLLTPGGEIKAHTNNAVGSVPHLTSLIIPMCKLLIMWHLLSAVLGKARWSWESYFVLLVLGKKCQGVLFKLRKEMSGYIIKWIFFNIPIL